MSASWIDQEPGWAGAKRELRRLARRAWRRRKLTVLLTVLLTGLIVLLEARKLPKYEANVVLRVTEGDFDPASAPPTSAQLKDYLADIAFSRGRLVEIMEEHGLYPSERSIDLNFATDTMRDDIEVEVVRNYFSRERFPEDPPRSARVAIGYHGRTPEEAIEVARHLGRLVAQVETQSRKRASEVAAQAASHRDKVLREHLLRARQQQTEMLLQAANEPAPVAALLYEKIRGLARSIDMLESEATQAARQETLFDLREAVEEKNMGIRFELVDPGRAPRVSMTRSTQLVLLALVVFVLALPVCAIGVGAYDPRVYGGEDLLRLGIEPLGRIPSFRGAEAGSLRARWQANKKARCES